MSNPTPTVFVVDDDEAVRKAVQWLVEGAGLNVLAFPSAEAFLAEYAPNIPGCLVLDVRMPGISGLELQDKLAELNIALPVIIITGHADVPTAVHALTHGAMDFIQKPLNRQVLLDRIRKAIQRDAEAREKAQATGQVEARLALLTARERQVLDLIMAGNLNKQIATQLGLSSRTVEKHRAQIMAKMEAKTSAELVLKLVHPSGPKAVSQGPANAAGGQ